MIICITDIIVSLLFAVAVVAAVAVIGVKCLAQLLIISLIPLRCFCPSSSSSSIAFHIFPPTGLRLFHPNPWTSIRDLPLPPLPPPSKLALVAFVQLSHDIVYPLVRSMIGIILYNMLGFSLPGNMAGSLQNPKRNFPLSMLISIILIIANYILPVLIVAAVPLPSLQGVPRWSEWQLGYFSLAADKVYSLFLFPLPCF